MALLDGRKTVTTAGTRVQLAAPSTGGGVRRVAITALEGNTGKVIVGGPAVIAALATRAGVPLAASETITLDVADLAEVWLDSMVNGEGVSYLAQN